MSYDIEPLGRRIPTLVQYCQRVACAHVENIQSLGEGWRYDLIRPVLESCTPNTLKRFEEADPYIANETADIWKALFLKEFPIEAHRYESNAMEEPESWRAEFFAVRDRESQRFNQLSVKLKASRQEEEERKRESAIKLTDRIPPAKRLRTWGAPSQPKTLFQRTKTESARLRNSVFTQSTRPSFQRQRIVPNSVSAKPPPPSSSSASTSTSPPVVVRSVVVVPRSSPSKPPTTTPAKTKHTTVPIKGPSVPAARLAMSPPPPSSPPAPSSPPDSRSPPPRGPLKKNPTASLFMPKHRAYSQVPRGVQSKP